MSDLDAILQRFIEENVLSKDDEMRLLADPEYAVMYQNSKNWQQQAEQYQQREPMDWDRESTWFEKSSDTTIWTKWIAPAAFSMSFAMCSLVIFNANIRYDDSGLAITFNNSEQSSAVTLNDIQNLLAEHQTQANQATFALVKEAVDTGRLERREDISALVKHLNAQRDQDRALIRLQLNELAEQVEEQPQSTLVNNTSLENFDD